jgi:hypothetical protein
MECGRYLERIGTGKLEKGNREWKEGGRENRGREARERE